MYTTENPSPFTKALQQGHNCYQAGEHNEALRHYREAVNLQPGAVMARYNLGVTLRDLELFADARTEFEQVLRLNPNIAAAHNNLGILAARAENFQAAQSHYRHAIALKPDLADAHFNLGMLLLHQGEITEGWKECEWRWQTDRFTPLQCRQPRWDGQLLDGTLLIHTEQGAGDAILSLRFVPEAARRARRTILICPEPLQALFRQVQGIAELRGAGEISLRAFDAYCPIMSLPHVLGITPDQLPGKIPYLHAPESLQPSLPKDSNPSLLRVGIAWAGSPTQANDRHRSLRLSVLRPLLEQRGVQWFSLQKEVPKADHAVLNQQSGELTDLAPLIGDYADTASLMVQLDLVITVDTSVAHLAGALGKPCWVLLCRSNDWRWKMGRNDNPWYPSLRLFRQDQLDDWSSVIEKLVPELNRQRQTARIRP